jgi:ribosomal protein L11 methyltransferase
LGSYPALDVAGVDDHEQLLALVDDFSPSAITDLDHLVTIYFTTSIDRDRAASALARALPGATTISREVDDEDWARRSQESLEPITVGRITIAPPWAILDASPRISASSARHGRRRSRPALPALLAPVRIVIAPSMGFGTGHHATTRLCLAALQRLSLEGLSALDVGTGSGVLAIAARLLGARSAFGIDSDGDAIQAARENLELNRGVTGVQFEVADLRATPLPASDVVTANLTGALLIRSAALLRDAAGPQGRVIVSGLLTAEEEDVIRAFEPASVDWRAAEDGWVGLIFGLPPSLKASSDPP